MSEDRAAPEEGGDTDLDTLDDILGLEPDEPETLPDETDQQQPEEEPQPRSQPTRGERRVQTLRQRLREQEEENRRLRDAVLATTQRQPAYQPTPPPDPYRQAQLDQQEAERVAMMQPHEVAAYYANKAEQRMQNQLLQARLEAADVIDRQAFERIKDREPYAEKFASQVEDLLQRARQSGGNPQREAIMNQLIAQEVRSRVGKKAIEQARRNGRQAIERQRTQPGTSRSNVTPAQRRQSANDESWEATLERLKGVTIGDL